MKNKAEKHKILMANREAIIKEDKKGTPVMKIAQEYGVSFTTIYTLLKKWGAKKRDFRRNYFKKLKDRKLEKEEKLIAFKKNLSPELLAKIEENTRINNRLIKSHKTIVTIHGNSLVQDILKKSEAIKEGIN